MNKFSMSQVFYSYLNEEEESVKLLAKRIGYGRTMQLCEKLWRESLDLQGLAGGELSTGCCVTFLVPCPGCAPARAKGDNCYWCCGAQRVTKQVSKAIIRDLAEQVLNEPNVVDPNDLTDEEAIALSFYQPNLSCVIEREPPRAIEETRRMARQELAELLRELRKYREKEVGR
jgi:hypothetical protein